MSYPGEMVHKGDSYENGIGYNPYHGSVPIHPSAPINHHHVSHVTGPIVKKESEERTITVSGFSEYLIEPDQVEIIVMIRSAKPTIEEVKLSVNKRKDYIVSIAQQNKLIYRVNEDFITSHDKNYKIESQVTITMSNYKKAQVTLSLIFFE